MRSLLPSSRSRRLSGSVTLGEFGSGSSDVERVLLGNGGGETASGMDVSERSSLGLSAVYAACRILGESEAMLPLRVYRRKDDGSRELARDRREDYLLHEEPNPEMSAFSWRESAQGTGLCLWGNTYAEIEWNGAGKVAALWPLRPDQVTPRRVREAVGGGRWRSRVVYDVVEVDGAAVTLGAEDVLHVPALSFDGLRGISPIRQQREAVALGMAVQEYGARFFGNGAVPGGYIKATGVLGDKGRKRLREAWDETHRGRNQWHRVAVLEAGLTYERIGIPPEEAQFLETRKFQLSEVARLYRIPPHMLADLDRSTNNNIEHQGLEFVAFVMLPWLIRWEQELNRKLFRGTPYYAKHDVRGLLRGDQKSRYEAYAVARQWGWMSADDVRELEDENPLPDGKGKVYLLPLNMQTVGGGKGPAAGRSGSGSFAPQLVAAYTGDAFVPGVAVEAYREAARKVLELTVARFVARERKAVERIASRAQGRREALELFYSQSESVLAAELRGVVDAFGESLFAVAGEELAAEYVRESQRELLEVLAGGGEVGGALVERVSEWASSRAAVVARSVGLSE
ncbi:MAG: phage portal protein [Myxococcales bacterium]|nr:phage portal protein [Myxococcales bacterium]